MGELKEIEDDTANDASPAPKRRRRKGDVQTRDAYEEYENYLIQKGIEDTTTVVDVSVTIWFTKEFASIEDDVQGYIATCFEEANDALANSGVPMRLVHLGTSLFPGAEIHDSSDMLDAFADHDGDMNLSIHKNPTNMLLC